MKAIIWLIIAVGTLLGADAIDIYATTYSGPIAVGNGSAGSPYHTLAKALQASTTSQKILLRKGSGTIHRLFTKYSGGANPSAIRADEHPSALDSTELSSDLGNFAKSASSASDNYIDPCKNIAWTVTIEPDTCADKTVCYNTSDKAVVSWWDLNFSCVLAKENAHLIFNRIEFTGQHIFYNNCAGTLNGSTVHYCTHCHMDKTLKDAQTTATGETFPTSTTNGPTFALLQYSDKCQKYVANNPSNPKFAFLVLKGKSTKLELNNCIFEHFRARTSSVIHIYRGSLVMNNVDFKYMEAGPNSMAVHESEEDYLVYGIITASLAQTDLKTGCNPSPCKEYDGSLTCFWTDENTLRSSDNYAKPCDDTYITWTGGTVSFLNHDHNFQTSEQDGVAFYSFMDVRLLNSLTIDGVTFTDNLIPVTASKNDFIKPIININYSQSITIQNCSFTNNLGTGGIVKATLAKEYISASDPTATIMTVKDTTFSKNDPMYGAVLMIYEDSAASVVLEGVTFTNTVSYYTNSASSSAVYVIYQGNDSDLYNSQDKWVNQYTTKTGVQATQITLSKDITLTLKTCTFSNNFGMSLGITDFLAYKLPNIKITDVTQSGSKPYSSGGADASVFKRIVDNSRMNKLGFDYTDLDKKTGSGGCFKITDLTSKSSFELSGTSKFSSNTVSEGVVFMLTATSTLKGFTFAKATFSDNKSLRYSNGGVTVLLTVGMAAVTSGSVTSAGALMISECTFTSNAGDTGTKAGALYVQANSAAARTNVYLYKCTFTSNSAASYGAVYAQAHSMQVESTSFTSNSSTGEGGVITFEFDGKEGSPSFKVTDSTFTSNTAQVTVSDINVLGEASSDHSAELSIKNTTFKSSTVSPGSGSIIKVESVSLVLKSAVISGCTFSGASLKDGSGVLYLSYKSGVFQFQSSTIQSINTVDGTYLLYSDITESSSYAELSNLTVSSCTGESGIKLSYSVVKMSSCTFTSNSGGSVIQSLGGSFTDSASTFKSNSGDDGIIYDADSEASATFTGSTFASNKATSTGGVARIAEEGTKLTLDGVTATENTASEKGGVVYCKDKATLTVKGTSAFTYNKADKGSAFYFLVNGSIESTITSATLANNRGEGVVYLSESYVKISTSKISSNEIASFDDSSPGIYGVTSKITLISNTFSNHTSTTGAFLIGQLNTVITDSSSTYDLGYAKSLGGILFLLESNATLTGSTITNTYGADCGAIFCFSNSYATLSGVTMKNITSKENVIALESSSSLIASDSTFSDFNATLIMSDKSGVSLSSSTFKNGSSKTEYGGALQCNSCTSVSIKSSKFNSIANTVLGGCLYFTSDTVYAYTITDNTFYNCNSTHGGAIYTTGVNLTITGNNFTSNHAIGEVLYIDGKGGAMQLLCPDSGCSFNVSSNTFTANTAQTNGGAINWENLEPTFLNNTYVNNSADYGNDIACFTSQIVLISTSKDERRRLTETGMTEVASGQTGDNYLMFFLKDKYGNVVATDNDTSVSLKADSDTLVLGGTTTVSPIKGVLEFDTFSVTYDPGMSGTLKVVSSDIKSTGDDEYSIDIPVDLRLCILGEIQTSTKACEECPSGQYSLTENSTICSACPSEATCEGGADMYPNSGYWRSSELTDVFFSCLLESACLGSENETSKTGVCEDGYESNLCQSCEDGWSRTSKNTCGPCPDQVINSLRLAGIALGVVAIVVIMVRSTLKSAAKPKELHSVYIKILTNYLQLVLLVSSFNLNWPSLVKSLLSSQETVGSATEQLFSFDCYLDGNFTGTDVFYQKLVIVGFLPVFIVFMSILVWGPVALCRRSSHVMRNQLVSTIIVLLFLAHPSIVQTMFKAFSCMEVDSGETWLLEDLALRCWNTDHSFFSATVGLPGLLLWGLGIPTLALALLIRNRANLRSVEVKTKYGFLYIGYKYSNFYWELVILYRKIAIAFTSVFLSSISVEIQALTVMIVILVAFNLQLRYMPYENLELNMMETRSIVVAGVTIYCGLYFLTNDLSEQVKICLFVLILSANVYFIVSWIFGISNTFLVKIAKSKPYLIKKICRCIPSLSFAADLAIREAEGELYYGYRGSKGHLTTEPLILDESIDNVKSVEAEQTSAVTLSEELRNIRSPTEFFQMMIRHHSKTRPITPSTDHLDSRKQL